MNEKAVGGRRRVYLAGPDIFHPRAEVIAANKSAICEKYGLTGVSALDGDTRNYLGGDAKDALSVYANKIKLLKSCDGLIANMSPFRGASMDPATALEMGVMVGLGKPVTAYTLDRENYADRLARLHEIVEEPLSRSGGRLKTPDGLAVEDFGFPDAAMVTCAALDGGAEIAENFEQAVLLLSRRLGGAG